MTSVIWFQARDKKLCLMTRTTRSTGSARETSWRTRWDGGFIPRRSVPSILENWRNGCRRRTHGRASPLCFRTMCLPDKYRVRLSVITSYSRFFCELSLRLRIRKFICLSRTCRRFAVVRRAGSYEWYAGDKRRAAGCRCNGVAKHWTGKTKDASGD